MGLLDFLQGDRSYSVAEGVEATTPLMPFPDVSKLTAAQQRKVIDAWIKANERIALYNKADRLTNLGAFIALFGGQAAVYSQLSSFYTTVDVYYEKKKDGTEIELGIGLPGAAVGGALAGLGTALGEGSTLVKKTEKRLNWAKVLGTSGVLTGLSYMSRNNAAGVGIPLTAIIALVGLDILSGIL